MSRIVVTGLGIITSVGNDLASSWEALCNGKPGVGESDSYDTSQHRVHFGAEVRNFDPALYMDRKEIRHSDPYEQLAIATARQALDQSSLMITDENADDIGVYIGSGIGGLGSMQGQVKDLLDKSPCPIHPVFIIIMITH